MVVSQHTTARAMGAYLEKQLQGEPGLRSLWVWKHPERVELWLVTDVLDADDELRLYATASKLYAAFQGQYFEFHILSLKYFDFSDISDLRELIPADAEPVPLSTATSV